MAALVFLDINGFQLEADEDALADLVMDVAQGKLGKEAIAAFLALHARPV